MRQLRTATAIAQFTEPFTTPEAYAVQKTAFDRRLARGEKRIGMKMGFTSRAKMIQMGVSDLIWGRLTDKMLVEEGGVVAMDRFIHPRVEPEVAFLIGRPLRGTVSMLQAQAAIEAIAPATEIIDSRYRDFKFSLGDVIADNASSSALVIGPWSTLTRDVSNLGMIMSINGSAVQNWVQCRNTGASSPSVDCCCAARRGRGRNIAAGRYRAGRCRYKCRTVAARRIRAVGSPESG